MHTHEALVAGVDVVLVEDVQTRAHLLVSEQSRPDSPEWVSGLTKDEAERLLDWLQANDCGERQVFLETAGKFTVRYCGPAR